MVRRMVRAKVGGWIFRGRGRRGLPAWIVFSAGATAWVAACGSDTPSGQRVTADVTPPTAEVPVSAAEPTQTPMAPAVNGRTAPEPVPGSAAARVRHPVIEAEVPPPPVALAAEVPAAQTTAVGDKVVFGVVVGPLGQPVMSAEVCTREMPGYFNGDRRTHCTTTDVAGRFRFSGMRARDRTLEASTMIAGPSGPAPVARGRVQIKGVDIVRPVRISLQGVDVVAAPARPSAAPMPRRLTGTEPRGFAPVVPRPLPSTAAAPQAPRYELPPIEEFQREAMRGRDNFPGR